MSLWSSYKALSPRTRIFVGFGLMANAALALHFEDQLEELLGVKPTPEEQKHFQQKLPKISVVERDTK
ncbi:uncharacterized protein HMPREF1541_02775 [Cyphellophora europaea CBS 101466]|uniref:Uncharacterized protein n=1 Tax=Cyphellophora europaea (strain CBS 101466) TaxID=1220924 RepID=W2S4I5_CYPE1|nr:uncharacterized protein HMPREF1541_02775 [Cyphellophora europaea CBS 101466]ETN43616.1 hypothetical protein HMPREF1541_02775 [Cyphellophora europaea CBS 101466]